MTEQADRHREFTGAGSRSGAVGEWLTTIRNMIVGHPDLFNAGLIFSVRVASALLVYASHIVMARWMGTFEYGIYIYAWTWVVMVGSIADFGLMTTAQRFIPQYVGSDQSAHLSGFLKTARIAPILTGCLVALVLFGLLHAASNFIHSYDLVPLTIACVCIPIYVLTNVQEGVARAFGWMMLGSIPDFILRPVLLVLSLLLVVALGWRVDARLAMLLTLSVALVVVLVQVQWVNVRTRKQSSFNPKYEFPLWSRVSMPIAMFAAFHSILASVDILVLEYFRSASEVASYYAASKTLAFATFVTYSVSAISAPRFSALWVAGDRAEMGAYLAKTINWTFWPSVLAVTMMLLAGKQLLFLFGPEFVDSYGLMFIVAAGIVIQSVTGPAESLLNMVGQEKVCAAVYAISLAICLIGCLLVVPRFGATGAALVVAMTLAVKSALAYYIIRSRLSLHAFIWPVGSARTRLGAGNI